MDPGNATLRWLSEFAAQGILTTDTDLKICGWNRWLEICSGLSAGQVLGRNLLEVYPELVERRLDRFYRQALDGQATILSHRFHHYLLPMPVQSNRAGFHQMQQAARIAPLTEGERVVGTITIIEDVTDRAVREEELRRQIAVQDALHEIDRAILSLDLNECLRRVVDKTAGLVGAPLAAVVLRENETLRVAACTGAPCDLAAQALGPASVAAWATESRQATLLNDLEIGTLRPLLPDSRSVVAAPLLVGNQVIGALVVESPRPDAFTRAEQELVIALATQAAVAIHNAQLYSALRESEDRYRDLVEHSHDLICTHDLDGRFLSVNLAAARSLGYEPDELVGKNIADILAPEVRSELPAYLEAMRKRGEVHGLMRVLTRTGERRIWEYINSLRTEGIATPIVRGMAHDVTGRLQAEKRSKAFSELGHRLSAAATPEAAGRIIVEAADRLLGWDACYFDLYAEEADQLTAVLAMDIMDGQRASVPGIQGQRSPSPLDRRVIAEGGRLILRDVAPDEAGGLIPFGDTSRRSASLMFVPIRSGERVVGILSIQSYTPHAYDEKSLEVLQALADHCGGALERIQAQAAEHEQRLLAEALRDTATALASTLSRDELLDRIMAEVGRVVPYDTANIMLIEPSDSGEGDVARIVRCRGYVERGLDEAAVLALRFPVAQVANLRQMIETGQPCIIADTHSYPAWIEIPASRWVRSYVGVPICSKGQTIGFLNLNSAQPGFFTSVHTGRLQAFANQVAVAIENARLYEEVRRHAAELEQRVAERTAELSQREAALRAANERLKELGRLKSEFVSNISHELRTPLTNIKTSLWLLEKGKPEKHDQYMATLGRETDLLQQLIEDLLQISRLDLGKAQMKLAPVDLNRLVTLLVEDRSVLFSNRGLRLELRTEPALPPVLADQRMLTQVLTNLMTNAMNYTPAGGVVTVSTQMGMGDWRLGIGDWGLNPSSPTHNDPPAERTWVSFSVSDTGPGIPPGEQARLFERFYRGEAARQSGVQGTGLGLAICREIVERHGGRITVESQVGKGSTFTVWLPTMGPENVGRGS